MKKLVPERIAPFVTALAETPAQILTGQIFGVRNNEIYLFSQPRPIRSAHTSDGWTAERIAERVFPMFTRISIRWIAPATSSRGTRSERWHSIRNGCATGASRRCVRRYTERDAILYALGVGLPDDPVSAGELEFLLEDRLKVLPTFAVTLATLGMWVKAPELEIDWVRLLHAAQGAVFHQPLPRAAEVIGAARIKALYDRGAEKGSICVVERMISDAQTGALYCTIEQTLMLRGNGGFGGEASPKVAPPQPPQREPDGKFSLKISPRAALIYRLSGDLNPLHADPRVARKAGFERPILHGLASYGMAGARILRQFGAGDPRRLKSLSMRFAGVVMPGDELELAAWQDGGSVYFEARARGTKVLDQGVAVIAPA